MTTINPYQAGAPWPCMRADARNSGRSPLLRAAYAAPASAELRRWSTGNGIFSTPVIGADETIYVGSADKRFYAFDPVTGAVRWSYATGECIDSAGCIAADGTIYFASCDAGLYGLSPAGEERWRLNLFENRRHFTPSTIFWWEGNVVLGPNGWLYAGNDDFNFYAIEPGKDVRWAYLTGLHIWSAPAFGEDGSVVFFSFDCHAYKLDRETGARRWSIDTGNFVVSSPALASDGTIHFGSFDGNVYALDGGNGGLRWRVPTAGPIYASPALAEDGSVYVGSSDGNLYALDGRDGRLRWSFYTGDAIRASASLGPDPEGRSPYLIYFGSGNGRLYCVEPEGTRRWALRTAAEGSELDSPNINASIALGRSGLAAATASGHVLYVPYDHYLRHPDDPAFERGSGDGYPSDGAFFYFINPGGGMSPEPLASTSAPVVVDPSQALSLRLLKRRDGRTLAARLIEGSIEVESQPSRPMRLTLQPDRAQLNVIPAAGEGQGEQGTLVVRARYGVDGEAPRDVSATLPLRFAPAVDAPSIEALPERPFRITHMSIFDPPIVPSFDQIGIASLTLQLRIVHVDAATGRVVAWGLLEFGSSEEGEAVQVAIARHLFYAFAGHYERGRLILEARACAFELTAFPVPLDLLRLSGTWQGDAGPCLGSSLVAELDVGRRLTWSWRSVSRLVHLDWSAMWEFARRWVPDVGTALRSLPSFARLLSRAVPLGWRVGQREMYGPWGLIGEDGWFRGVGSFRSSADRGLDTARFVVRSFGLDTARRCVEATITTAAGEAPRGVIPGILLIDRREHLPLLLDYTTATRIERTGDAISVSLTLPEDVDLRPSECKAILMVDVTPLAEVQLA